MIGNVVFSNINNIVACISYSLKLSLLSQLTIVYTQSSVVTCVQSAEASWVCNMFLPSEFNISIHRIHIIFVLLGSRFHNLANI